MLCMLAGDVLQLPVPLRCADLLPGAGSAPEGLCGRNSTHVHTKGNSHFKAHLSKFRAAKLLELK